MRRIGGFCFVMASLVAAPAVVHAQQCLGTASFADGRLRAELGTTASQGWQSFGVGLALGRERGAFVSGSVSHGTYTNNVDVSSNGLSASVGYQVPIGTRWQLCPKLNLSRSKSVLNSGGTRVDYWGNTVGISTAVGVTAWSSRRFDMVPSAELSYAVSSARMQAATRGIENEARGSYRGGGLSIAPGLIFGKVITVNPFVMFPLGVRGARNVSGVSVGISFGPRR
ncbi:MAG: hypothetical protein Q8K55_16405 [Gemmatimonadaceae bacterium]|nr:hypothetical protein [Gemmatimonadaceae bacterium]